jgi:two-component system C4-dicarboxylate transport sensor histidine kinase DctB
MSSDPRRPPEPGGADDVLLGLARGAVVARLVPGVAHELSNLLTTILGHVRIVLGRSDLAADLRDRLQFAASEGAQAARLLHALQAVSRTPGTGRRPCSLADHAQRVLELTRDRLHQDGVRVVTELGNCPVVRADEQDLQQAILALVQRAGDSMRGRGDGQVLTVRTGHAPGGARLEVLDTGPGDDVELPGRVTGALESGPHVVGLALARHIAAAHGGRLLGARRPEGGMVFTIDLPAASGGE